MKVYCAVGHSHRREGCDGCDEIAETRTIGASSWRCCAGCPVWPSCAIGGACSAEPRAVDRVLVGVDVDGSAKTFRYVDTKPRRLGALAALAEAFGALFAPAAAPQ